MTYLDTVQIFRCQGCGKWSHAKKQPKKHTRIVIEGRDPEFDEDLAEPQNWDDGTPAGHYIDCGPFAPYVAAPGRYRR